MRGEQALTDLFVQLADTLVAGFDIAEFLQGLLDRCAELLGADAAGLVLTDQSGRLEVLASTSDDARLLELFQLQIHEGPCLECQRSGRPVAVRDLATAVTRWPRFTPACRHLGFAAVLALPMRRREHVIGALEMFLRSPGGLDPPTARLAQALTDVATIGLLQQRARREQELLVEQLQGALSSRVVIEQAKGVLAERLSVSTDQAFTVLRHHARSRNYGLTDLARAVLEGAEDLPHRGRGGPTAER
jgi:GAF domain-containing protein